MAQTGSSDRDNLGRAFGRLRALKANLPDGYTVSHVYVIEFHAVLDQLEGLGEDVADFRVPAELVRPGVTSWNSLTNETSYTEVPEVDRDVSAQ